MLTEVEEARLREQDGGLVPENDGWFIVNVAQARGLTSDRFGASCRFEGPEARFPEFAINVRVLQPGQRNGLYHREGAQEAFLVLDGECIAIVEEQERPMGKGDFLYTPTGTAHIFVGAGEGPCSILMVGTRKDPEEILYPVSEKAARHGASAEEETDDPGKAYAGSPPLRTGRIGLPW
jgi:uncharacterized cupin superfamily protein